MHSSSTAATPAGSISSPHRRPQDQQQQQRQLQQELYGTSLTDDFSRAHSHSDLYGTNTGSETDASSHKAESGSTSAGHRKKRRHRITPSGDLSSHPGSSSIHHARSSWQAGSASAASTDLASKRKLAELELKRRYVRERLRSHHSASVLGDGQSAGAWRRSLLELSVRSGEEMNEMRGGGVYVPHTETEWLLAVFEEDTVYREEGGEVASKTLPSRHREHQYFRYLCTCCEQQCGSAFEAARGPEYETLLCVYYHCGSSAHRAKLRELFPDTPRLSANSTRYLDSDGFNLVFVNGYPTLSYAGMGGFFQTDHTTELTSIECPDASDPFGQSGISANMIWQPSVAFSSIADCCSVATTRPAFVGTQKQRARSLLYGSTVSESFSDEYAASDASAWNRDIVVIESWTKNILGDARSKRRRKEKTGASAACASDDDSGNENEGRAAQVCTRVVDGEVLYHAPQQEQGQPRLDGPHRIVNVSEGQRLRVLTRARDTAISHAGCSTIGVQPAWKTPTDDGTVPAVVRAQTSAPTAEPSISHCSSEVAAPAQQQPLQQQHKFLSREALESISIEQYHQQLPPSAKTKLADDAGPTTERQGRRAALRVAIAAASSSAPGSASHRQRTLLPEAATNDAHAQEKEEEATSQTTSSLASYSSS